MAPNHPKVHLKSSRKLIFYAIMVENKILPTLGDISSEKSVATSNTMDKIQQLLNYLATNLHAIIIYNVSSMIILIYRDASYISVTRSRSRAISVFSSATQTTISNVQ